MPCPIRLEFFHFKDGQELMLAQLEERVPFAALQLLEVEHILVEFYRRLHIIDLDGQMVASVNLHAHDNTVAAPRETSIGTPSPRELFAFRDWNQHRYLALVSLVGFAVDIGKIPLFELKCDQNVGERDSGE